MRVGRFIKILTIVLVGEVLFAPRPILASDDPCQVVTIIVSASNQLPPVNPPSTKAFDVVPPEIANHLVRQPALTADERLQILRKGAKLVLLISETNLQKLFTDQKYGPETESLLKALIENDTLRSSPFYERVGRRIKRPNYSSTEPSQNQQKRHDLIRNSMGEIASINLATYLHLHQVLMAEPAVAPIENLTLEVLQQRFNENIQNWNQETWLALYDIYRKQNPTRVVRTGSRTKVEALISTKDLKKRLNERREGIVTVKNMISPFLAEHMNSFITKYNEVAKEFHAANEDATNYEIFQRAFNEFEKTLPLLLSLKLKPLFSKCFCPDEVKPYSSDEIYQMVRNQIFRRLKGIETLYLKEKQPQPLVEDSSPGQQLVTDNAPGQPPSRNLIVSDTTQAVGSTRVAPPRPAVSHRKKKRKNAQRETARNDSSTPTPKTEDNPLTEEEVILLIDSSCYNQALSASFTREFAEIDRRYGGNAQAMKDNIINALLGLDAGRKPNELGIRYNGENLYEMYPLNRSDTSRLYFAEIGGRIYLYDLVFDSKSGTDKQHKTIQAYKTQIKQLNDSHVENSD